MPFFIYTLSISTASLPLM